MADRQQYDEPAPDGTTGETGSNVPQDAERIDSVAAQIRRQLRAEGAEPADKQLDFQLTLRAGGNELTDSAQEFSEQEASDYQPPEFEAGAWSEEQPQSGGAMRMVIVGLLLTGLLAAGVLFGLPAFKEYSAAQEAARERERLAKQPPLQQVMLDEAFHAGLTTALQAVEDAWKTDGKTAYIYRYRASEEIQAALTQTITISAAVGGKDAEAAAAASSVADSALATWRNTQEANQGVSIVLSLAAPDAAGAPGSDDRYIRYGYDYGREHMAQLQPLIDAIEARGSYDRVLSDRIIDPPIKTSGGFAFMPRGYGYLPIYRTDSAGYIQMGSGGTLASMTPQAVIGYYLFLYLDTPVSGMDLHGPEAVDYYTRKIAPLPYDTGTERLRNVQLKPDGKPDGVACVVKNGKLLPDGER